MGEHYPRIRIQMGVDGVRSLYIRESVSITFYMRSSHRELVKPVLRALDVYRNTVGLQRLGWYINPYNEDWDELDDKGWAYVRSEMHERPATSMWLRELPSDTTGYEFNYQGRPLEAYNAEATSAVAFHLPTEYMEEHGPGHVQELALKLAAELPFNSGHAGLAFDFPEGLLVATRAVEARCSRYPGMDVPGLHFTSLFIGTKVDGVHWLNFLGPPVLGGLGGAAGLRAQLHSPGMTVRELDGERAVVMLGEWPEAGDTEQGHTLPAYRELARVLEPWLHLSRTSDENMRRWERRFLD
ncbi:hypothetical protein CYFUS_003988 [Cystobacter fuscus]|uniref:DUF3396 domain-containing protein n=2 Tax=Cystobacter fuscus TaxID=43 RepID=A0A250J4M4_9BACT|nr:hypothetical protein CYFUS_003988 [Cystobacter fuscus]